MRTLATILGCFLSIVAAARQAGATPILTTTPADLAGGTLIDFEDLAANPITTQYSSLGVTFAGGLFAELTFPPLVPGGTWGAIAASNGDPHCCPPITMSFSNPLQALGFEIISLDAAVTTLDVYTVLAGVSTFAGQLVLDTSLEVKFFGILANPADTDPFFDSVILTTLLGPSQTSGFVMDNLRFEAAPAAVPEPATLTLLGAGVFGLIGRARRRSAQRQA